MIKLNIKEERILEIKSKYNNYKKLEDDKYLDVGELKSFVGDVGVLLDYIGQLEEEIEDKKFDDAASATYLEYLDE